jgi:hypothetical protein
MKVLNLICFLIWIALIFPVTSSATTYAWISDDGGNFQNARGYFLEEIQLPAAQIFYGGSLADAWSHLTQNGDGLAIVAHGCKMEFDKRGFKTTHYIGGYLQINGTIYCGFKKQGTNGTGTNPPCKGYDPYELPPKQLNNIAVTLWTCWGGKTPDLDPAVALANNGDILWPGARSVAKSMEQDLFAPGVADIYSPEGKAEYGVIINISYQSDPPGEGPNDDPTKYYDCRAAYHSLTPNNYANLQQWFDNTNYENHNQILDQIELKCQEFNAANGTHYHVHAADRISYVVGEESGGSRIIIASNDSVASDYVGAVDACISDSCESKDFYEGITDGAAIGKVVTDAPETIHVEALSMWVANDDPQNINDKCYLVNLLNGAVTDSFITPRHYPQGLVVEKTGGDPGSVSLIISDDAPDKGDDSLFVVRSDPGFPSQMGTVLDSFPASGYPPTPNYLSPRALVESSTNFEQFRTEPDTTLNFVEIVSETWIANGDSLCLIDMSNGSLIRVIPSPCPSPQGLEYGFMTGLTTSELWVVCDETDSLYLTSTTDGSIIRTIPAPSDFSSALACFAFNSELEGIVNGQIDKFWQGENTFDTMEELNIDGTYVRRIYPSCCPDSATAIGDPIGPGGGTKTPKMLSFPSPNPLSGTRLSFWINLERSEKVRVSVFDVGGRLIGTLVNEALPAGSHPHSFNLDRMRSHRLVSGIYFLCLDAKGTREVRKFLILR